MSELSQATREIVTEGVQALAPSAAARERMRAGVAARIAAGGPGGAAAGASATSKMWLVLVAGGIVAGAVGWHLGRDAGHPPAPTAKQPAPTVQVPVEHEEVRERDEEPVREPPPKRPARAAQPPRSPSELEREIELLDRARRALQAGEPARALVALDLPRRELRAPQMAREATLLRAEALCGAGRTREGRHALAELDRRWPDAPGSRAARAACDGSD